MFLQVVGRQTRISKSLPFDRFGLVGQIRPLGRVINEEYTDTGLELTVVLANADRDRLVSKYGKEILKG